MAEMLRVKMRWSGFTGGPGYSVFHFREFEQGGGETQNVAQESATQVHNAFGFLLTLLPSVVRLRVESDVELIEDTTGELQNVFNVVAPPEHVGQAPANTPYSAASGAVVNWRTGGVRNGRRIRGKTFIVPLHGSAYGGDGTLSAQALTDLQTFGTYMIGGATPGDLGVWARPSGPGATNGEWSVVNSFNVPDMAAVLRSRRD